MGTLCWYCEKNEAVDNAAQIVDLNLRHRELISWSPLVKEYKVSYDVMKVSIPRCNECKAIADERQRKQENSLKSTAIIFLTIGVLGGLLTGQVGGFVAILIISAIFGFFVALIWSALIDKQYKGLKLQTLSYMNYPMIKDLMSQGWRVGTPPK